MLPDQCKRLQTVLGLADDGHVARGLEDHPEAGAHECLVIGDKHPDHRMISFGMETRTTKPPLGPGSACSAPP